MRTSYSYAGLTIFFLPLAPFPGGTASAQTCAVGLYQDSLGEHSATFRTFAEKRMKELTGGRNGISRVVAWNVGHEIPPLAPHPLPQCTEIILLYSGHGPVSIFYPEMIEKVRAAFPGYRRLTLEDSSCASMASPAQVQAELLAPRVRPQGDQVHEIWGNQLCTGPMSATAFADCHFSWYGLRITSRGSPRHLVAPCHTDNTCVRDDTRDDVGARFWCRDPGGNPVLMECHEERADAGSAFAWRIVPNPPQPFPDDSGVPHARADDHVRGH